MENPERALGGGAGMSTSKRMVLGGGILLLVGTSGRGWAQDPQALLDAATRATTPCTYYASPTGGGDGKSQAAPFKLKSFWSVAQPGTTLCLLDGTYTGAESMIQPPQGLSGQPGNPITVRALNDGKVLLDAEYSVANGDFASQPAVLRGNSWFVIEGINAAHGSNGVVGAAQDAHHNVFRRVIAWDGGGANCDQNAAPMGVGADGNPPGTTDNLFEDVAAWGCGRKTFGVFRDTRTTVLRGFFMKNKHSGELGGGGAPLTYAYDSIDNYIANTIVTQDLNYGGTHPENNSGVFDKDHYMSYDGPNPLAITHTLRGNIAYVLDAQGQTPGTQWMMGLVMMCGADGSATGAAAGITVSVDAQNLLIMRRNAGWPKEGFSGADGTCAGNTSRNWTDSVGDLVGGTQTTDAGVVPLASFKGGLLNMGAATQPSTSAWLRYRYNADKSLSSTALWPWPMNQRIQEALLISGYAQRGLDGKGETDLTKLIFGLTGSTYVDSGPSTTPPAPVQLRLLESSGAPNPTPPLKQP